MPWQATASASASCSRCLAVALLLTGCGGGGTLGPRSLAKQSDAVQSLAAEGALLAQDGVDGKTTGIFTREHGGFLAKAATTAASSLAEGEDDAGARAEAPPAAGALGAGARPAEAARERLAGRAAGARPNARRGRRRRRDDQQEPRVSLKNVLAIALGIMSAIGGFVDIGDLVFNTQAGATFGFQLLWVDRRRRRRDHRLLGDVRTGLGGLQAPGLRSRARACGLRRRADDADRVADRQSHDLRGRGRRRRDLLPAALGPALPAAHPGRRADAGRRAPGCCRSSGSSASSATSASACSSSPSRRSSCTRTGGGSRTASCPAITPAAASRSTSTSSSACWAPP